MIVVHSYGKVASTTLFDAVAGEFPQSTYFTHCMQPPLRSAAERFCANHPDPRDVEAMIRDGQSIWAAMREAKHRQDPDITILTGVREPIGRSVSVVMQTLNFAFADCAEHAEATIAASLRDRLTHIWCDGALTHGHMELPEYIVKAPLVWLKDEIEDPLGLAVHDAALSADRPYVLVEHDRIRFLIYRQESFFAHAEACLSEVFPGHAFNVQRANDSAHKATANIYKTLQETFKLPRDRLRQIYDNPYVAGFYQEDEVNALIERWAA